ncbi:coenzyme F420-0:L-glutamate ligase [Candidatus Daviesbacteria bacterium]|nr:coenzyme F420-0:L-glutamate ligase [Candidatus Daviesbacteria bacterium]
MIVKSIKTRKFLPPKDDLWGLLSDNIKSLKENSVVAVTSKIVSIGEGRCIPIADFPDKDKLVAEEADKYLPRAAAPHGFVMHTIKNGMMVASAGIDESNGANFYILWPKDPQKSAQRIWEFLKEKFKVKNLGVIITDSRLVPLKRGVLGIAIGYFGFKPLRDYRGKIDIFGREFKMETSNLPDSLATAAVLEMGEGNEQTPIGIITDTPYLEFTNTLPGEKVGNFSFKIPEKEDMFHPLIAAVKWKKGGSGKKGYRG